MKFYKRQKSGFTLVETLVAISILSLSVLATFTAVTNSLDSSMFARDQVTAFYLIQESMEFFRNLRDQNALHSIYNQSSGGSAVNWLQGISAAPSDPCYFGNTCIIDSPKNQLKECSGGFGSCENLDQDTASSGLFGYNDLSPFTSYPVSKFKREIQLTQVGPDEIIIKVQISWSSGLISRTIQVQETLFNTR